MGVAPASAGRRLPERNRTAALVIASVAIVVGVLAFVAARHAGFSAAPDRSLRKVIDANRLGSLVLIVIGSIAFAGAWSHRRALLIAAAVAAAAAAVLVVVQTGQPTNWLGGRGNTFAFFAACAVGFSTLATLGANAAETSAPRA